MIAVVVGAVVFQHHQRGVQRDEQPAGAHEHVKRAGTRAALFACLVHAASGYDRLHSVVRASLLTISCFPLVRFCGGPVVFVLAGLECVDGADARTRAGTCRLRPTPLSAWIDLRPSDHRTPTPQDAPTWVEAFEFVPARPAGI